MYKFFTAAKQSIPGLALPASIGALAYFSSQKMEKQRAQLEKENPGFKAIAKPQYIPGHGTAWSMELTKTKTAEELPAFKNRP